MRRLLLALALVLGLAAPAAAQSSLFMSREAEARIGAEEHPKVLAQFFGVLGLSVPHFWVAVVLIIVASFVFHWLPPMIFAKPWENPIANLQQMFLPVVAISLGLAAEVMRMTRSSMLEVLGEEYVRTARAKGLGESAVTWKHVFRNALITIVTIMGLQLGGLLAGSIVLEQVFYLPGLGRLALGAISARDLPVVQGVVVFVAATIVTVNFLVDLLYGWLDPRIHYD